MLSLH